MMDYCDAFWNTVCQEDYSNKYLWVLYFRSSVTPGYIGIQQILPLFTYCILLSCSPAPQALESLPGWHRLWRLHQQVESAAAGLFYHLLNQTVALLCPCEASLSVTWNDSWIRKCQVRAVRSTTKMFHHQNLAGSNKPGWCIFNGAEAGIRKH